MTDATRDLDTIWIPGEQAIWKLVLPPGHQNEFKAAVFAAGVSSKYSIGEDRILQKALAALGFQARVYTTRADKPSFIKRAPLIVIVSPIEHDEKIRSKIDPSPDPIGRVITLLREKPKPSLADASGYSTLNAWQIHRFVIDQLKDNGLAKREYLNLNEAASIWKGLTGNVKSTVYDWMRRGPVFKPASPVERRVPAGCKLDIADLVTIGLLHGLVSHGLVFRDFQGPKPAQFMPAKSL